MTKENHELPYGGHPPAVDSDTSRAAAASLEGSASRLRARVLKYYRECGALGSTDDRAEFVLGMRHQTLSARRRELVLLRVLRDSGRRSKTRSGRTATVWVVVP